MMTGDLDEQQEDGSGGMFLGPPDIKLKIVELNTNLTCYVCKGYLRDAATITECLHSFCKSCIVKHFRESIQCPRCRILVHPTYPLINLRPDNTLTDIVNKILPHLQEEDRRKEIEFYKSRNLPVPPKESPTSKAEKNARFYSTGYHDDLVSLELIYIGATNGLEHYEPVEKNFVRVSGKATVRHVQKFISRHMQLDAWCDVCVFHDSLLLHEEFTLQDMMHEFKYNEDSLLQLKYGITHLESYVED